MGRFPNRTDCSFSIHRSLWNRLQKLLSCPMRFLRKLLVVCILIILISFSCLLQIHIELRILLLHKYVLNVILLFFIYFDVEVVVFLQKVLVVSLFPDFTQFCCWTDCALHGFYGLLFGDSGWTSLVLKNFGRLGRGCQAILRGKAGFFV